MYKNYLSRLSVLRHHQKCFHLLLFSFLSWAGLSKAIAQPSYCSTGLHLTNCSSTDNINSVSIANTTLFNDSTGCGSSNAPGYSDYPAIDNTTATLHKGQIYMLSVTSTANSIISVWIDYNRNGVYEAAEWEQITTSSIPGASVSIPLNIHVYAQSGLTGMRIRSRMVYNYNYASDACTPFSSGETEDYVLNITGGTGTSNYCPAGLHTANCSAADNINSFSISGTSFNNANSGCGGLSGPGFYVYAPSSSTTTTLQRGQTYAFNVTSSASSIISIWIDYDQDNVFEPSEWTQVTTSSIANVTQSVNIAIPVSALNGTAGMRVRSRAVGNSNNGSDACTQFESGETEEYTITIAGTVGSYCTTSLHGGNCSSTDHLYHVSIESTNFLNLTGCSSGSGPAYTSYPVSPTTTATLVIGRSYSLRVGSTTRSDISAWIDYNGNNLFEASEWTEITTYSSPNSSVSASIHIPATAQAGTTRMRIRSKADATLNGTIGSGDACTKFFSGETEDYTITLTNTGGTSYCDMQLHQSGCSSTDNINAVSILGTTLSNQNTGCTSINGTAYTVYPATGNTTATLTKGQTYTLSVTSAGNSIMSVWIDFNKDNVFSPAEWHQISLYGTPFFPEFVNITIPNYALTGTTRMRIRSRLAGSPVGSFDACIPFITGETEDYTITIKSGTDVGLSSINSPVSGCSLSAASQVCVTVRNYGVSPLSNIPISYQLNGDAPINETLSGIIPAGAAVNYCFAAPANLATPGSYSLTASINLPGDGNMANDSMTSIIHSGTVASAPATGNSGPVCEGNNLQLTTSAVTGATYTWSGPNGFTSTQQTPVISNVTASDSGVYSVTITTNGCSSAAGTTTVIINPTDSAAIAYPAASFCKSGINPIPSVAAGVTGNFTASPAGLVFTSATSGEVGLSASTAGTYTVTFTTSGACPSTDTAIVIISNPSDASFTYNGTSFCQEGASISPFFATGASSGTFSASPAGLVFVNASTGEIDMAASAANTYTVTNTIAASGGCSASSFSVSLAVVPTPTIDVFSVSICAGYSVTIGSPGMLGVSYSWTGPNGFTSNQAVFVLPNVTPAMSGVYTLTGTYNGCSHQDSMVLSVLGDTAVTISGLPADACTNGTAVTLTATPAGGTFNGPGISGAVFSPAVAGAGTHLITYSYFDTSVGCTSIGTQSVIVSAVPTASFTVQVSAPGNSVTVTNNSTGALTYSYDFGDGSALETGASPTHAYAALGTYTITLTVTGAGGCVSSTAQTVTIATLAVAPELQAQFELYPNPTSGLLYLDLSGLQTAEKVTLEVYNLSGEKIRSREVSGSGTESLDLSTYATGTYTIRILTADMVLVKQVMLQQ
jgi:hypothetical protein